MVKRDRHGKTETRKRMCPEGALGKEKVYNDKN